MRTWDHGQKVDDVVDVLRNLADRMVCGDDVSCRGLVEDLYDDRNFDDEDIPTMRKDTVMFLEKLIMLLDGRVMLPVDAYGVPIRIWDVLVDENDNENVVRQLVLDDNGWHAVFGNETVGLGDNRRELYHFDRRTPEDVLREFGLKFMLSQREDHQKLCEEYARRLGKLYG